MGKCIFEDVCDKSWCRLYSFECVDGQIYKPKTSNEQSKVKQFIEDFKNYMKGE